MSAFRTRACQHPFRGRGLCEFGCEGREDVEAADQEEYDEKILYFSRFLETRHQEETIPMIEDIANQVNAIFKI